MGRAGQRLNGWREEERAKEEELPLLNESTWPLVGYIPWNWAEVASE